jgi:plasmid stabilization system protein ParE
LASRQAPENLRDIESYTLQEWGELQWEEYEAALWQALESLGENSHLGRARDDLHRDVRVLVVRQHIIIYSVTADMVRVAPILHRSRDLRAALQ